MKYCSRANTLILDTTPTPQGTPEHVTLKSRRKLANEFDKVASEEPRWMTRKSYPRKLRVERYLDQEAQGPSEEEEDEESEEDQYDPDEHEERLEANLTLQFESEDSQGEELAPTEVYQSDQEDLPLEVEEVNSTGLPSMLKAILGSEKLIVGSTAFATENGQKILIFPQIMEEVLEQSPSYMRAVKDYLYRMKKVIQDEKVKRDWKRFFNGNFCALKILYY